MISSFPANAVCVFEEPTGTANLHFYSTRSRFILRECQIGIVGAEHRSMKRADLATLSTARSTTPAGTVGGRPRTMMALEHVALTKKYFDTWNAHDVPGIQALHAPTSTLTDWDGSHGPTNEAVAKGIGGIWEAAPAIKIEIVDIYTV